MSKTNWNKNMWNTQHQSTESSNGSRVASEQQATTSTNNNVQDAAQNNRDASDKLRSIEEVPEEYRAIFSNYRSFNIIQSQVLDTVLNTDESIAVSAPTGSGKTVIFELAVVRFLQRLKSFGQLIPYKIVYVAPMKALCEERLIDWFPKFSALGLNCISVTGDSDFFDFQKLANHNFIITTPEKWDSLTRKWKENKNFVAFIKLFMMDEVHLLNDFHRGPTVEVIVSRMKTIQNCTADVDFGFEPMNLRFVTVSATIPNVEDIAAWLTLPAVKAKAFKFGDEMRPVKLKKVVIGYSYNPQTSTPFKFDIMLNYKLPTLMQQYSEGKPTLIFCGTRKNVEMTSRHLILNLTFCLNDPLKQKLQQSCNMISEVKLKETIVHGVGFHHAGLSLDDRKIVEDLFRNCTLPVLVTTSTLAMGINLPAHLVIIKSTKYHNNREYQDYSDSMVMQMIGRAGRPQFDSSAIAVILTTDTEKDRYENMVCGVQAVESSLHLHLTEHINAEVVLSTITDLSVALEWISSTFLYIRAGKNPTHYNFPNGLTLAEIDKKLLDVCHIQINKLSRAGMLNIDENDVLITPTQAGILMAKYYVTLDTMKLFTQVSGAEILSQILSLVSKCQEFSEMYLRVTDKKALNLLNNCRGRETIRYPFQEKIKTVDMKINCIIQAVFGCLEMEPFLVNESQKIMRTGERMANCLAEFLFTKRNCFAALLNTLILAKCFRTKLWENSPYVSKQLSGIGAAFSQALVQAGKTSFKDILRSNPRDIEMIINRKSPMGNTIQEQIQHLPRFEMEFKKLNSSESLVIHLNIHLRNAEILQRQSTVEKDSSLSLLVGDNYNNVVLHDEFKLGQLIDVMTVTKTLTFSLTYNVEIEAHLISANWVGIDCQAKFHPVQAETKPISDCTNVHKSDNVKMTKTTPKLSRSELHIGSYFKKQKKAETSNVQKDANDQNKNSMNNLQFGIEHFNENTRSSNTENGSTLTNIFRKNLQKEPAQNCDQLKKSETEVSSNCYDLSKKSSQPPVSTITTIPSISYLANLIREPNENDNDVDITRKHKLLESMKSFFENNGKENSNRKIFVHFKYQPHKKLNSSSKPSTPVNENQSSNSSVEECTLIQRSNGTQKTITWSSPLVTSPATKYSPNPTKGNSAAGSATDGNSKNTNFSQWVDLDENHTYPKSQISDSASLFTQAGLIRPTLRDNLRKSSVNSQLSDKEFYSKQNEKENESNNDDTLLISSTFLETLGTAVKPPDNFSTPSRKNNKQTKNNSKAQITATDYYLKSMSNSMKDNKSDQTASKLFEYKRPNTANVATQTLDRTLTATRDASTSPMKIRQIEEKDSFLDLSSEISFFKFNESENQENINFTDKTDSQNDSFSVYQKQQKSVNFPMRQPLDDSFTSVRNPQHFENTQKHYTYPNPINCAHNYVFPFSSPLPCAPPNYFQNRYFNPNRYSQENVNRYGGDLYTYNNVNNQCVRTPRAQFNVRNYLHPYGRTSNDVLMPAYNQGNRPQYPVTHSQLSAPNMWPFSQYQNEYLSASYGKDDSMFLGNMSSYENGNRTVNARSYLGGIPAMPGHFNSEEMDEKESDSENYM